MHMVLLNPVGNHAIDTQIWATSLVQGMESVGQSFGISVVRPTMRTDLALLFVVLEDDVCNVV